MPFNVCDKNGNHIGFKAAPYPQYFNVFMAAVTTEKIDDQQIDINLIKDRIAGLYGCKNILGKVNDEKFEKTIENLLENDFSCYKDLSSTDFLKLLALKNLTDARKYISYNKEYIRGYVLIDIDKFHFSNGTAIIDETVDYISDCSAGKEIPIYAKIIDYPIINTDCM
jgi:hypothetical protein